MTYMNQNEANKAAELIAQYLQGAKAIEIGASGKEGSTLALKDVIDYVMDIDEKEVPEGVELVIGDAAEADLSGLDAVISLGLAHYVPDIAEKVLANAGAHNVKYAILSPGVKNIGSYSIDRKEMIGDKELCFYKL